MMAYLLLLPVILLFASAAVILVLRRFRRRPGYGYSWLLAVLTVLVVWGLLLYFRFYLPPPVIFLNWLPVTLTSGALIFQLDTPGWVYTFGLAGLAAAVIFTASARLQYHSTPTNWAANLGITAAGMLATMAATPLALVLAWTVIDAIELAFFLSAAREKQISADAVVAFVVRVTGTLILMGTMVLSRAGGQDLLLIDPHPDLSIFLLLAAGLRLGVLPIHLPYMREPVLRRGVSTSLRMTAAASSLVLLGRLPATAVPSDWYPWLLLFAGLAGIYGSMMWLISADEIHGRPYWMIALASLAVVSVVRSYPEASLAWGAVLILSGAGLFLFSARERRLLFLPALGVLALSGLPFTPGGAGWLGLSVLPINFPDFGFLVVHTLLMIGYLKHMFRPEETLSSMERWVKGAYPFGHLLLVATTWLVAFLGWPGSYGLERWWASLPAVLLAVGGWIGLRWLRVWWNSHPEQTGWMTAAGRPAARVANSLLRLDWVFRLGDWLFRLAQRFIQALTVILEGEGGVLWVLVLLTLLVSLLQSSAQGGR